MSTLSKLDEAITRINPGRKIDMEKICPYFKDKCIGVNCNAFTPEFDINVVEQQEVYDYIEQGNIDWQQQLEKEDWKLHTIIEHPMLHTLDEKTYIFTRLTYRTIDGKFGRCLIGCVK